MWLTNILLHLLGPLGMSPAPFGESVGKWDLLQASGFALLVVSNFVFAKGDEERLRKQMAAEAALILLDRPLSVRSSVHGSFISAKGSERGRFRAHSDIGSSSLLSNFMRSGPGTQYAASTQYAPSTQYAYGGDASSRAGTRYMAIVDMDHDLEDLGPDAAACAPAGASAGGATRQSASWTDSLASWPPPGVTPPGITPPATYTPPAVLTPPSNTLRTYSSGAGGGSVSAAAAGSKGQHSSGG